MFRLLIGGTLFIVTLNSFYMHAIKNNNDDCLIVGHTQLVQKPSGI
jgi:hypothetical protein